MLNEKAYSHLVHGTGWSLQQEAGPRPQSACSQMPGAAIPILESRATPGPAGMGPLLRMGPVTAPHSVQDQQR